MQHQRLSAPPCLLKDRQWGWGKSGLGHSLSLPDCQHHKAQATSARPLCGHCGPLGAEVIMRSVRAWRSFLNARYTQVTLSTLLPNEYSEQSFIEKIFYQPRCPLSRNLCHLSVGNNRSSHVIYHDLAPPATASWLGMGAWPKLNPPWDFRLGTNWELNFPSLVVETVIFQDFLVVQWLRICLPVQGTWVLSLVGELRSHICCYCPVAQSCPTLWDPMDCSTPGLPVHHPLPELAQTHVHWVGDANSVVPFSSHLQSFPASGFFLMSWLFVSGGQSIGASASVLPMNIQDWLPLGLTGWIS